MLRRVLACVLGLVLLTTVVACGEDPLPQDMVEAPAAGKDFEEQQYKVVVEDLEAAGFTNVETKAIEDLITGWMTKDGEVEDVKINGSKDFESGDRFAKDAKVVVRFHTFPEDDKEEEKEPADDPSETPSPSPTEPPTPQVITAKNNPEFAAMLKGNDCDDRYVAFAKKHAGEKIQFEGSVMFMAPHGDYDTRFDFLIGPGDKGPNTTVGPQFKFEDENVVTDLNLTGNVGDTFGVGDRALFTAEVDEYNADTCLFFLEPVETKVR